MAKESPATTARARRFVTVVLAVAIAVLNAYAFTRPMLHQPADVLEWRKGPLIKDYSPYASANSARIFWPVAAGMADAYLLILLVRRRRQRARGGGRPSVAVDLAISCAALLVVLAAGELASRALIRHGWYLQYRPEPELYWYNRPGLVDHTDVTDPAPRTTNSLGFRMSREVVHPRSDGEYRIFAMGDSSTFGLGVRDGETFLSVLERHLAARTDRDVLSINTACPGHTSFQGRVLLDRHGEQVQPDLLIWAYNNDPCLDTVQDRDRIAPSPRVRALQRVLYRSDLYLLFRRVILDAVHAGRLEHYRRRYPQRQEDWVRRIPFDDYQAYLTGFAATARELEAEILFLRMPLNRPLVVSKPIFETSFDDGYRDHLSRFCEEEGLACVDLEHPFGDSYRPDLFLPGHLFHPSATGHRIIGATLADRVIEEGWLTEAPGGLAEASGTPSPAQSPAQRNPE